MRYFLRYTRAAHKKFKRVKLGLELYLNDPRTQVDLDKLLDNYVASIDEHFVLLLRRVSELIPVAETARDQGKTIHRYLVKDQETVHQELNYGSLWKRWWVNTGWKGDKMRKDLELAGQAIAVITNWLASLKIARDNLAIYRTHIRQFKVLPHTTELTFLVQSEQTTPESFIPGTRNSQPLGDYR